MFTNDCKKCGKEFLVTDDDLQLFTTQNVPLPELCEECRAGVSTEEPSVTENDEITVTEEMGESTFTVVDLEDDNSAEDAGFVLAVSDETASANEPEPYVIEDAEEALAIDFVAEEPVEEAVEEAPVEEAVVAAAVAEEVAETVANETLADTENTIEEEPQPEVKKAKKEKKPLTKKDKIALLVGGVILLLAVIGVVLWGTVGGGFGTKTTTTTEAPTVEVNADVTDEATEEVTDESTETTTEETTEPEVTYHEKTTIPDNVYVGDGFTIEYNNNRVADNYGKPTGYNGGKVSNNENNTKDDENDQNQSSNYYTFANQNLLTQHYKKHGAEVGATSESDYVAKANAVITNPNALTKTEAEDGDKVYFVQSTGEIVFVSTRGYIRTYFIADYAYFQRT